MYHQAVLQLRCALKQVSPITREILSKQQEHSLTQMGLGASGGSTQA